jgi:hypothetical protein
MKDQFEKKIANDKKAQDAIIKETTKYFGTFCKNNARILELETTTKIDKQKLKLSKIGSAI